MTHAAEELRYQRYQVHLRLINKVKPRAIGRFRDGRFYTMISSAHKTPAGRKLNTMLRIKNRLAGGY